MLADVRATGTSVRSAKYSGARSPEGKLYRPRSPRLGPLWQCPKRHERELREYGRMRREIEGQVVECFITCGDPREDLSGVVDGVAGNIKGGKH
jgi:hypothetical protein